MQSSMRLSRRVLLHKRAFWCGPCSDSPTLVPDPLLSSRLLEDVPRSKIPKMIHADGWILSRLHNVHACTGSAGLGTVPLEDRARRRQPCVLTDRRVHAASASCRSCPRSNRVDSSLTRLAATRRRTSPVMVCLELVFTSDENIAALYPLLSPNMYVL